CQEYRRGRFESHVIAGIAVAAGSCLISLGLATRLQGIISRPIHELVRVARAVLEKGDYSLRAEKVSEDEAGLLTDAFNKVLAQAEKRATDSQTQREVLEKRVAERTAELQKANEQMRLLQSILVAVGETDDVPSALRVVLSRVCEATGWQIGQAWVLREDGKGLECCAAWHATVTVTPELRAFRKLSEETISEPGSRASGRAWEAKKPLWIADVSKHDSFMRGPVALQAGIRAGVWVPVLAGGNVVAMLEFFMLQPGEPEARLVELASAAASRVGAMILRKRAENALRLSEQRFRLIARATTDGVWDWDLVSNRVWRNETYASLFLYKPEEVGADHQWFLDRVHPEDRERIVAEFETARNEGAEFHASEYRFRRADGQYAHVYDRAYFVRDERGVAVRAVGGMMDITGRRQAEEMLRASEERYRRLHESMTDAFVKVDMKGRIQEFNPAYRNMLGYTDEELRQLTYVDLTPEKWHVFEDRIVREQILLRGHSAVYEKEYRRKDGTVFPVELRTFLLRDRQGEPSGMWAIVRDVTERKRAEDALRESEDRYRSLFATSMDAVLLASADGRILGANAAACQMFGRTEEELKRVGRSGVVDLSDPRVQAAIEERARTGRFYGEMTFVRGDGSKFLGEVASVVYRDAKGEACASVVIRDITERQRAEQALQVERQRLLEVLEGLPTMICLLTPDYHVAFANRSFRNKFGESHGRHCYEYCFGQKAPCPFCETYNVLKTGKPHHWEVTTQDGSVIDVYDFPFTDVDGSPMILEMDVDITERKRMEEALRKSEQVHRASIEAASAVPYTYDPRARRYEFMGAGIERLTGYTAVECTPEKFGSIIEEIVMADGRTFREMSEAIREFDEGGGTVWRADYRIRARDGSERWLTDASVNERDADGHVFRSVGLLFDITERKRAEEALRESEERVRIVLNNSLDVVYRRNMQTNRYDFFSPAVETVTGYSVQGLVDANLNFVLDRVHPDDLAACQRVLEAAQAGETTNGIVEYRFRHKNGDYRWLSDRFTVVKDGAGQPLYWVGVSRDITDQRRVEAALADNEQRLRMAMDAADLGIWDWDLRTGKIVWGGHHERLFGLAPGQFDGTYEGFERCVHPDDRQGIRNAVDEAMKNRASYAREFRVLWPDGSLHWIAAQGRFDYDATGQAIRMSGVVLDITTRKQAEETLRQFNTELERRVAERTAEAEARARELAASEEKLRESEARYRNLVESAIDVIFTLGADGTVQSLNQAFEKITGWPCHEWIGRPFAPLFHPDDVSKVTQEVERTLWQKDDPRHIVEARVRSKSGRFLTMEFSGAPCEQGGRVVGILGIARDITEHKRLEQALLDISEREQRRIGQDLHDGLCQHLAGVAFMSNVLAQKLADERQAEADEARKIAELVRQAAAGARTIAAGLHPVKMEAHGAMDALQELARLTEEMFKVKCLFHCDPPVLISDNRKAVHLYRIAQEAVHNAIT
ncbi:MAG: PAS domain S-box protein, partial [Verrucomicrobiae bacterium]|nr:PAS domain S-box protein [Verrucomicrobiae bacterium]